jgi:hypothetical protein
MDMRLAVGNSLYLKALRKIDRLEGEIDKQIKNTNRLKRRVKKLQKKKVFTS